MRAKQALLLAVLINLNISLTSSQRWDIGALKIIHGIHDKVVPFPLDEIQQKGIRSVLLFLY